MDLPFTDTERDPLIIIGNYVYQHAYMRINYTTYDLRRDYDIITARVPSRSFVMFTNPDDTDHPFGYARVLAVLHTKILHYKSGNHIPMRVDLLWVRWMTTEPTTVSTHAPQATYTPLEDGAFGFLDPADVVRGSHMIPEFFLGRTLRLLPLSSDFRDDKQLGDWGVYYINQ